MGVFKNDVGRPSNKTIMIKTVLKVIGLIVIIAIAFGIGYYFNDKQNKNDSKSGSNNSNNSNNSDESDNSTQLEMKLEYQTGFSEEKQYTDAVEKLCFSRNPNKNISGVASCNRVLDRCPLLDLNHGDCTHLSKDKEEAEKQKKAVYNY